MASRISKCPLGDHVRVSITLYQFDIQSYVIQTVNDSKNIQHCTTKILPSLFVNKAVFSLRESILLSTITVEMSVLFGCQHGIYAMSFAASVTS